MYVIGAGSSSMFSKVKENMSSDSEIVHISSVEDLKNVVEPNPLVLSEDYSPALITINDDHNKMLFDNYNGISDYGRSKEELEADILPVRTAPKIGRNESCPCGSGKKFKKCCGN